MDSEADAPASAVALAYLEAELHVLDLHLQRAVRLWQMAGQDPQDDLRGLQISDAEAAALLQRPLAAAWGHTTVLLPEEQKQFDRRITDARQSADELARAAIQAGQPPRLLLLADRFNLDRFDLDVLLLALAPALDLRYERLYGYLQDNVTRRKPSIALALDLLCPPGLGRMAYLNHFSEGAPLLRFHLLEYPADSTAARTGLIDQPLQVDQTITRWLLGQAAVHALLAPSARLIFPEPGAAMQVPSAAMQAPSDPALQPLLQSFEEGDAPIWVFSGADQGAKDSAAQALAAWAGKTLLSLQLPAPAKDPLLTLQLALRDGLLHDAVLYLSGWDHWLAEIKPATTLIEPLLGYPGPLILETAEAWFPRSVARERRILQFSFPLPGYTQRLALWQQHLGSSAGLDLAAVAGQFHLTTTQIRDAAAIAHDLAARESRPLAQPNLLAAARACSNPLLSNLAHKIKPRYTRSDIILPEDQAQLIGELIDTVRSRPTVLDAWGIGRKLVSSNGVTVLFAGPPGTGKTMAAEIIAGELGMDLYKIELSAIVSKYIGETEKNLDALFAEAEASNAVLFFDEADALFGKRSQVRDAHDRYANIEISYLLQRMEGYNGVTILATNLRSNLDEAFTRRLQFAVDFPFPDENDRLRIWQALFPPGVPRAPDLDLPLLAHRFKLAGGNIRNILVGAAYLAAADGGTLSMPHLLHSARRELSKMGRLLDETEWSMR